MRLHSYRTHPSHMDEHLSWTMMNNNGPIAEDNVADFPGREQNGEKEGQPKPATPELDAVEEARFRLEMKLRREQYEADEVQRKKTFMNRLVIVAAAGFVFIVFNFLSLRNPEIYDVDPETLRIVNQAINAIILLTVPFVLGTIGAAARILISDINPQHKTALIVSSGLMAVFSWVSIKSGVLVALLAPHIERANLSKENIITGQSDFYTLALVAIAVGMFATNVYLMIAQRVDQLTLRSKGERS
ncbi:hypothetical protein PscP77CL_02495 [Pseudomonas syringae]|nr:hypothetical protein [Pseudomonas syringae]